MDFRKFLEKTAKKLDREVGKILGKELKEVQETDRKLVPLIAAFAKSCQGGKRLRGALVVLGYQIAAHLPGVMASQAQPATIRGDLDEKAIFKIAAAYEIMHSAILVHDDIIDKSLARRGQPSLYQALGGDHRGVSLAVTLADAGFFLATKVIAESKFSDKEKIEALRRFSKTMLDTAMGQILDIEKGDSLMVAKYKTAQYSVSGPLVLGAILGGVSSLLSSLAEFGEALGITFQIQDDILDSEADFWGGVDQAKKAAEKFKNKAMKILPEITKDKTMSNILEQMAEYLVERSK